MARHRMRWTQAAWPRRIGLGAIAFGVACVLALAETTISRASHLGPPVAPPPTAPPGVNAPPPSTPPPAPAPTKPDELVKVSASDVFLLGRKITVSLACQRSGVMSLSRKGHRLGSDRFECAEFAALPTVKLKRAIARGLANKLVIKGKLTLRARFDVGDDVLAARLNLRANPAARVDPTARRDGLWWTSGYLSCGGRYSSPPGLNIKPPGFTAQGYGNFFGFFFNDTNQDDWVAYQPWLYEHGHGWAAYGWQPQEPPYWYYVPSGTGINVINQGLQVFSGYNAYLAGAVQVFWYHGARDWNFVNTSHPGNGIDSTVYDSIWCYVP